MLSPDHGPARSDPRDLGEPVTGPVWLEPWPDDLAADDESEPEAAYLRIHRETGLRNNEIPKVVVSDSLTADDTAPWTETTTIVRRADAHQAVADLKDRPGKDLLTFGSPTLWNDLVVAGLVDELHLMIGATVLGGGTPMFGAGPIPPLRLVNARRRDGSDNVLLRYEVVSRDE